MKKIFFLLLGLLTLMGCTPSDSKKTATRTIERLMNEDEAPFNGLIVGETDFQTRPRNVLLTGNPDHRLSTIFKINYNKRGKPFFGSNQMMGHYSQYGDNEDNQWHRNFMPGFEVVSGYNMINISHYNLKKEVENTFFEEPVLVKNLYYPTFSKDTLNGKPVRRKYYMVSVYDEDTNHDSLISVKDLRRLYLFDLNGENKFPLIPLNYAVMSSEYDPANDYMYIFAKLDQNKNGKLDKEDPTNIFWIDLKKPEQGKLQYRPK